MGSGYFVLLLLFVPLVSFLFREGRGFFCFLYFFILFYFFWGFAVFLVSFVLVFGKGVLLVSVFLFVGV